MGAVSSVGSERLRRSSAAQAHHRMARASAQASDERQAQTPDLSRYVDEASRVRWVYASASHRTYPVTQIFTSWNQLGAW